MFTSSKYRNNLQKHFTVFVVFLCLNLSAQTEKVEPSILFIGNSYTHYNNMPSIFDKVAEAKGMNIDVEMSAKSSHSFNMHSKRIDMYDKIREKKWDYIVLQGFSRELSYSPSYIDTASVPYIQQILDSVYLNNSCTNVLLFMTWGYKDGFLERSEIDSYEKMSDSVKAGYRYISKMFDLPIVPVGKVWDAVKKTNKVVLYQEDGQHPSLAASQLIAYTFFTVIFGENPINSYKKEINTEQSDLMANTAYKFVHLHQEEYNLLQNVVHIKGTRTAKGEYLVNCFADFPKAHYVKWYFGDGKSSLDSKVQHEYKRAREYEITLVVEDECGIRKIRRTIKFEKPAAPLIYKNKQPILVITNQKKI